MTIDGIRQKTNWQHSAGSHYNHEILTQCGFCYDCRLKKQRDWIVRLHYESMSWCPTTVFHCIFTYNEQNQDTVHCPESTGDLTYQNRIYYRDFQLFMKRLRVTLSRYNLPHNSIRFFGCTEYGTKKGRRHIHCLLYGVPLDSPIWEYEILDIKHVRPVYHSLLLDDIWGKGYVRITRPQNSLSELVSYMSLYFSKNLEFLKKFRPEIRKLHEKIYDYIKESQHEYDHLPFQTADEYDRLKNTYKKLRKGVPKRREWCEQLFFSKSLGWDNFLKTFHLKRDQLIPLYINGYEYGYPHSWLEKLANMGYVSAQDKLLELQHTFDIDETLRRNDLKRSQQATILLKYKKRQKNACELF